MIKRERTVYLVELTGILVHAIFYEYNFSHIQFIIELMLLFNLYRIFQ
ncbi:conserved hypothetical protein [Xenorhabdus nematophila F1]|uniref:Uncharacterized protein n=1 Tax=Xenorhabdus nematophila (strain ATCC 19061 / DSM 3370 / CCUG 14189 / LMG 1036 / NCIMB 9965 / AN6) TaxID=406817 RepID=D3VHA4_XENNA|nr:hypothetical protein XNC1_2490 [Xenorhabdus nematophila ATCC 19061]CCW32588.1 conserved hypothetical protein [Xenorhabdus nematophila F1]